MKYGAVIGFVVFVAAVAVWFGRGYAFAQPSQPPYGVTVRAVGENQIEVSWQRTPGATGYWVSMAPGRVTFNAANDANTFIVGSLVRGTTYTYTLARSVMPYTVWVSAEARVPGEGWLTGPHSAGQTVTTP